ncbi:MAG TPA: hypothetical protein PKD18_14320, partial [Saprospiraceae bacterium]|nr:hypothetical protein [Saprospiraceae bacterium]
PTLSDFVSAIDASLDHSIHFEEVINTYVHIPEVHDLLISPFYVTGMKRSLLITTNSWFIGAILPQIFPDLDLPIWQEFSIYPSYLFENMDFKLWMDNGNAYPESARKIAERIIA